VRNQRNRFVATIASARQAAAEMSNRLRLLASEQEVLTADVATKTALLDKVCACGHGRGRWCVTCQPAAVLPVALHRAAERTQRARGVSCDVACTRGLLLPPQARAARGASVKEKEHLLNELHSLAGSFRSKHDKLQEQVCVCVCVWFWE
jgi:hypothetical protein